ncbi:hypothetical protein H2200_004658 [Cladophialophora chaetospira]|uniref:Uncharacterized protein n=1 Tax=Cladophialophora chaetospira TaxID=386627 RepID=A0AA38XE68_9EURO|nr:hypothetical protein H2200_004658 [Cladophialophora chaetospira]
MSQYWVVDPAANNHVPSSPGTSSKSGDFHADDPVEGPISSAPSLLPSSEADEQKNSDDESGHQQAKLKADEASDQTSDPFVNPTDAVQQTFPALITPRISPEEALENAAAAMQSLTTWFTLTSWFLPLQQAMNDLADQTNAHVHNANVNLERALVSEERVAELERKIQRMRAAMKGRDFSPRASTKRLPVSGRDLSIRVSSSSVIRAAATRAVARSESETFNFATLDDSHLGSRSNISLQESLALWGYSEAIRQANNGPRECLRTINIVFPFSQSSLSSDYPTIEVWLRPFLDQLLLSAILRGQQPSKSINNQHKMARSKFSFLGRISRAKGKLVSAFRKVVPRSRPEEQPDFEGFSDVFEPGSPPAFSYCQTPSTAYYPHNPAVRTTSGNFIQHFDGDIFWPEPVESPVYQHQNLRWLGARYEDGSSLARSSWETVTENADAVMSSLLRGLPEIPPRGLRRRSGVPDLTNQGVPDSIFTPCDPRPNPVTPTAATADLTSEAEVQQSTRAPNHDHQSHPSISEDVQVQVFTPPAREGSLGSPGPTTRGSDPPATGEPLGSSGPPTDTPTRSWSSRGGPSSRPSLVSLINRRPENPVGRDFALGSDTLPDPFVAASGPAAPNAPIAPSGPLLWSDFSTSSDSRASPEYLGNGHYRLHDGTIHSIPTSRRGRRPTRDPPHVDAGSLEPAAMQNTSDESNDAGTSDPYSGENEESSPVSPIIAVRNLDGAFQNLDRVAISQELQRPLRELARAVDQVVLVVDGLLRDMEAHAWNAQQRQRRLRHLEPQLESRTEELNNAYRIIQERDAEIHRLRNPEVFGEETTPPTYSSDVQAGHESVVRSASEPLTVVRHSSRAPAPSSPTPGAGVPGSWPNDVSHFSDDSDDSDGEEQAQEVRTGRDALDDLEGRNLRLTPGSAPPSYHDSPVHETGPQMTPETESPPSSEAATSDSFLLVRTPRHRRRSL